MERGPQQDKRDPLPWRAMGRPVPQEATQRKGRRDSSSGQKTMWSTLKLLRLFTKLKIPWALENPFSSNMWWVPALRKYWESGLARLAFVDQCAWGRPCAMAQAHKYFDSWL